MISETDIVLRLTVAAALGSVIGMERERLSWAAGLRTHMLVCVGSTLIMLVSAYGFSEVLNNDHVVLDPSRMAAQVVSGIGFLGAGSILLRGEIIRGLTTAASLWSVAAIGLAVGGGLYLAAVAATIIIFIILAGIKPLERRYFAARQRRELRITARRGLFNLKTLQTVLGASASSVKKFIVQQDEQALDKDEILIAFSRITTEQFNQICTRLKDMEGVDSCEQSDV